VIFEQLPGLLTTDIDAYEQPWRGEPGKARAVVRPSSLDEVRDVVRWAVREQVRLVPQGANTGLVGASTPDIDGSAVVLSTERLTSPFSIDPVERTAVVGAGVRLSTLNTAAAEHGLHLPIDLAADPTLGGMVATNTGGTRVLHYGALRQHVLSVQAVAATSDADVLGLDTALRKDSRGLDSSQLVIGSGGALCIVAQVTVSLSRLPTQRATWWVLPTTGRVLELLHFFEGAGDGLSAFELVSANALAAVSQAREQVRLPFPLDAITDSAALIEWIGPTSEHVAELFQQAAERGLVHDAVEMPTADAWAVRHAVTDGLRTMGTVLGHDVAVPRRRILEVRNQARSRVAELTPRARLCEFGHVGDGGLHLSVVFPHDVPPPTSAERTAIREALDDIVAVDGTYSAEHGLGPLNAQRWLATTAPLEQTLVSAVKQALDPHGILGHPRHPYNLLPRNDHLEGT
jgi:FAD/FMN-containing dehydrogenase